MRTEAVQTLTRNATRVLEQEARVRAAALPFPSAEHDFYLGVMRAAHDRLQTVNLAIHDVRWLGGKPSAFREGYTKTMILLSRPGSTAILHLALPKPDSARS